jgi:biopolymer transport protein ExbD
MSWQMRHEGSPTATSNLTAQQVLEGLSEGIWLTSDEVRGANEMKWVPVEEHPFFAEAVADLEPPPEHHDAETHLDMNPLIDVALVLLIFFILTTSYDALHKVLDMPQITPKNSKNADTKVVTDQDVKKEYVRVLAKMDKDQTVYVVDEQETRDEDGLRTLVGIGVAQHRLKLLIDAQGVTWDAVCKIIDVGKHFGMKMQIKVEKE